MIMVHKMLVNYENLCEICVRTKDNDITFEIVCLEEVEVSLNVKMQALHI